MKPLQTTMFFSDFMDQKFKKGLVELFSLGVCYMVEVTC